MFSQGKAKQNLSYNALVNKFSQVEIYPTSFLKIITTVETLLNRTPFQLIWKLSDMELLFALRFDLNLTIELNWKLDI